jgi:hypothetical protein
MKGVGRGFKNWLSFVPEQVEDNKVGVFLSLGDIMLDWFRCKVLQVEILAQICNNTRESVYVIELDNNTLTFIYSVVKFKTQITPNFHILITNQQLFYYIGLYLSIRNSFTL